MKLRGLRNRLSAALALGAFLALAVLTTGFNLLLRSNLDADANRVLRSASMSALETVEVDRGGSLRLLDAPAPGDAESGLWVYGDGRALQRPAEPSTVQRLADSLAGDNGTFAEDDATDTRLYARSVPDDSGRQVGTVVTTLSLDPYERTAAEALVASLLFAGVIFVGAVLGGRLLIARALRPVALMTASATDWSEHDLDHRFAIGEPYDELTELALAFDSMLERLASSLRHEQRLSAEVSHELRTPLAAILAEAELALTTEPRTPALRDALERIEDRAQQLSRILETLLTAARAEAVTHRQASIAEDAVARCLADLEASARDRGVEVRASGDGAHGVDVEGELLERMLAPLLENASRYAGSAIEVTVQGNDERVVISVHDDGPGLASEELDRVFEAGFQGSAAGRGDSGDGAGLGLALVRRLARAAGGEVHAVASDAAGAAFELHLPASGVALIEPEAK